MWIEHAAGEDRSSKPHQMFVPAFYILWGGHEEYSIRAVITVLLSTKTLVDSASFFNLCLHHKIKSMSDILGTSLCYMLCNGIPEVRAICVYVPV